MDQHTNQLQSKKRGRSSTLSIYGKVPPQSVDLEKAILGAIMLERDAFDTASEVLHADCFYTDPNQKIFRAMASLASKNMPIDLFTVVSELKSNGELETIGGPYYLSTLTNGVTSGTSVGANSKVVFENFLKREIIRITSELASIAYDDTQDAFDILSRAESEISEIGVKNIKAGMISIEKAMMGAVQKIEDWMANDDVITGIPSGFDDLDKATRGWQPGDLIVIAARPSVGKTAFALNIARNAAEYNGKRHTVAIWSLEMKSIYLALRMLSAESKNLLYRLQTGRISREEMQQMIKTAVSTLSKLKIFFDESSNITLQSLSRKARRLKKTENLGLIIVDYLQLMSLEEKTGNREQEVSKISRGLKNLAQELDIPIIALSQLSREMGSKNVNWEYGPPISAIRESGGIEQDADVIVMLWGPGDEDLKKDPTLQTKRKARIAKQRNGVLITETLEFKNEIQLFERIDEAAYKMGGNFKRIEPEYEYKNHYESEKPDEDLPF